MSVNNKNKNEAKDASFKLDCSENFEMKSLLKSSESKSNLTGTTRLNTLDSVKQY